MRHPARRGLIAAVDTDADNVFVVLSARKLNPKLHIVDRTSTDESADKLEMAGADRTLSPHAVGGRRLARHANPWSSTFWTSSRAARRSRRGGSRTAPYSLGR
jgi:voltage-gated potassium channel Kch